MKEPSLKNIELNFSLLSTFEGRMARNFENPRWRDSPDVVYKKMKAYEHWYRATFDEEPKLNWLKIAVDANNPRIVTALAQHGKLKTAQCEEAIRYGLGLGFKAAVMRKIAITALMQKYGLERLPMAQKVQYSVISGVCRRISEAVTSGEGWAGLGTAVRAASLPVPTTNTQPKSVSKAKRPSLKRTGAAAHLTT